MIFSAYVTGNNVVYYTKEGYSRPGVTSGASSAELEALKTERDLLNQRLQDLLKKYDAQQRELDRKLEETQKEQEKTQTQQQPPPLLKSW